MHHLDISRSTGSPPLALQMLTRRTTWSESLAGGTFNCWVLVGICDAKRIHASNNYTDEEDHKDERRTRPQATVRRPHTGNPPATARPWTPHLRTASLLAGTQGDTPLETRVPGKTRVYTIHATRVYTIHATRVYTGHATRTCTRIHAFSGDKAELADVPTNQKR